MFEFAGGGSAINSTGISDEQLLKNLCGRLSAKVMETNCVAWPPRINQLEENEEICPLLIQLLTWLRNPNSNRTCLSPKTLSLTSIFTQFITGKRTSTCINLGIDLHGHTRSTELVDNLHTADIIISYADIQLLHDKWAVENLNESKDIPPKTMVLVQFVLLIMPISISIP